MTQASLDAVVDRASRDPDFLNRLTQDPFGTTSAEGYDVSPDEIREAFSLQNTSDEELVEALRGRLSHSMGYTD